MTLLRERYELLSRVGRGAQGEVFLARDHQHQRSVAVKIRHVDGQGREAVLREARILLDLMPHPSLPIVREDFFSDGGYCLVMDWIDGPSLQEVVERGDTTTEEILDRLAEVAAAIDHLHAHDPPIVHGDIKPANIVLGKGGRTVLVDFGIAARHGGGGAHGTPGFVAPEVAGGSPPARASDIYALAATAFASLAGAPPRPGAAFAIDGVDPEDLRRIRAALEAGLSIDPQARPRSASELINRMRRITQRHNLPAPTTQLIGRERELSRIGDLLRRFRVVTLTGAGGSGKTRLAVEAAWIAAGGFGDGVWMVELAGVGEASHVETVVATELGVRESGGATLAAAIREQLRDQRALIVLDNCEHLIDECARLVEDLLRTCPRVRVLATSREPLGITGESTLRVPSLEIPDEGASVAEAAAASSVRLFLERAAASELDPEQAAGQLSHIVTICRRLDGIPLALEMAAARLRTMSLTDLAGSLADRFGSLVGTRTALPRHQTLHATMAWSYALLSEPQRSVFRRCAVFAGAFAPDVAAEVFGEDVAEVLAQLEDRSMLARVGERLRMLETIRQFAQDLLDEAGDSTALRARHRDVFLRRARGLEGDELERVELFDELDLHRDEFRAALEHAAATSPAAHSRACEVLAPYWILKGRLSEARMHLEQAADARNEEDARWARYLLGRVFVSMGDVPRADDELERSVRAADLAGDAICRGRALAVRGVCALWRNDLVAAQDLLERALRDLEETSDALGRVMVLSNMAVLASRSGDIDEAARRYEAVIALERRNGNRRYLASDLVNFGGLRARTNDPEGGRRLIEEAVELQEALGDLEGLGRGLSGLGRLAMLEGDLDEAERRFTQALEIRRSAGMRRGVGGSCADLGEVAFRKGDAVAAAARHQYALRIAESAGDLRLISSSLEGIASAAALAGDVRGAAVLYGTEAVRGGPTWSSRDPKMLAALERRLDDVRARLGVDGFDEAEREGSALTLPAAISAALAIADRISRGSSGASERA